MVRVPTYNSYMNMLSQTMNTKSQLDLYSYQTISGLKSPNYSGYGMQAHTIVSLEAMLGVTSNFMTNNDIVKVELNSMSTAMESVKKTIDDFKSTLTGVSGMDLDKASPDATGGEITFGSDNMADYQGKNITVNGTQYTFANDNTGNNIDISGATTGEDVLNALKNKLPANAEFTFEGDKFTFPLYTIDGPSTVLDVNGVTTGEPHTMSSEQYNNLKDLQNQAFAAMRMLADSLNTNVNGKYIFGGGNNNQAPVNFPFSSLEEFQAYYNGTSITYPQNSSANLSTRNLTAEDTGALTLNPTGGNSGTITAANPGAFLNQAVNANDKTTGDLTFDTASNTIKATEYGAFNTIKEGDTLVIGGNGAGTNGPRTYVVKSVSADGKTITIDDSTPLQEDITVSPDNTDPAKEVTFNTSYPIGTVINMEGFDKNISPQVQVTGVSADGSTLFVTAQDGRFPATTIPASKDWSLQSSAYYQGGSTNTERMISENQSLNFDINAGDPAFEKLFRALGEIAQGNLVDNGNPLEGEAFNPDTTSDRVEEAMKLIQDALYNSGVDSGAGNTDIYTVLAKINSNKVVLNTVQENQKSVQANLENSIDSLKNVDKTEAAVKALLASNNLSASYAVLQQAMNISILNYL